MIICKFCNTENINTAKRCVSCGGILEGRKIELSKQDKKLMQNYAQVMEKMIHTSMDDYDLKFALSIFVGFLIEAIVIYSTFSFFDYKIWSIIISILLLLFIIVAGSYAIVNFEKKSAKTAFETRIHKNIIKYLDTMKFRKEDFLEINRKEQKNLPLLSKFIDKI